MDTNNVAIGWDDDISGIEVEQKRDDFVVLPPGKYPFKVMKTERGQYNGSAKLPACGKMTVSIVCNGGSAGRAWVDTNFFMTKSTLWKIFEFMESVGLHKKGEVVSSVPWSKVDTDCEGLVELGTRSYQGRDGDMRTTNEVKKWLPLDNPLLMDEEY